MAPEARELIRRAAGDVVGKTVAAQIQQAARHLGYAADDWRPRELWYGRCASAAALDDLRQRFAAWREREPGQTAPVSTVLEQHVAVIRRRLARLKREVAALEEEIGRLAPVSGGLAADA